MVKLLQIPEGDPAAGSVGPWLAMLGGIGQGRINLLGDDGNDVDPNTGATLSSNNPALKIRSAAGKHLLIRNAADSADIASFYDSGLTLASPTFTGTTTLTGGQIAFPGVQVPSAGGNTLDDYEEGSWTPSVGGTATYTARSGAYIKIGRVVHVWFDLTINAIGTGSTNTISGLPFAADFDCSGVVDFWSLLAVNVTEINVVAGAATSTLVLTGAAAAAATAGVVNALGSSSRVRGQCTYRTAN